jgi:NADH-quinone oxidoreductase subunit G
MFLVVQDARPTPLADLADVVLAGATFAEKAGCYVNADGRLQYAEAVLPPRDGSLPDLDLFAILLGRAKGPVSSWDILAELAEAVPAFAAARGGRMPEFAIPLSGHEDGPPARRFLDPWLGLGQTRAGRAIGTKRAYQPGEH